MNKGTESDLAAGQLPARATSMGIGDDELAAILDPRAGVTDGSVAADPTSSDVELRAQCLLELLDLIERLCADQARGWLHEPNPVLALRSPIDVLVAVPEALNGLLCLLRSVPPSNENEGNGYEFCKQVFQLLD